VCVCVCMCIVRETDGEVGRREWCKPSEYAHTYTHVHIHIRIHIYAHMGVYFGLFYVWQYRGYITRHILDRPVNTNKRVDHTRALIVPAGVMSLLFLLFECFYSFLYFAFVLCHSYVHTHISRAHTYIHTHISYLYSYWCSCLCYSYSCSFSYSYSYPYSYSYLSHMLNVYHCVCELTYTLQCNWCMTHTHTQICIWAGRDSFSDIGEPPADRIPKGMTFKSRRMIAQMWASVFSSYFPKPKGILLASVYISLILMLCSLLSLSLFSFSLSYISLSLSRLSLFRFLLSLCLSLLSRECFCLCSKDAEKKQKPAQPVLLSEHIVDQMLAQKKFVNISIALCVCNVL